MIFPATMSPNSWFNRAIRLRAAAESDFVVALYNPRSQRRTTQLEKAITILSAHRPANTPVLVASCLGRENERVSVVSLAEFNPDTVDMMTIVLVGSSDSRRFVDGEGRKFLSKMESWIPLRCARI